ncbi:MAG: class E sortase [Actinobacteria bacterium]|nr:class E sortase [Actinomycetota bacterium]
MANLMIIGGILCIPGYFLGSCGYTWLQQRELLESLEEVSPQITVSLASLSEEDFIPIEIRAENAVAASSPATDGSASAVEPQDEEEARLAALAAAEAQHDLHLALFRAAADRFEADVGGKTGEPIGRIVIPSIGVDVVLLEGTSTSDLKEGPGHWEETPFPGQGGNFVVSGHRTTYGAPFYKLNELQVGEEIDVVLPYVIARYQVTEVFVVYPDEVETVGQRGMEQISLAACHPIYSAKQRIVAKGDLTSFILTEAGT